MACLYMPTLQHLHGIEKSNYRERDCRPGPEFNFTWLFSSKHFGYCISNLRVCEFILRFFVDIFWKNLIAEKETKENFEIAAQHFLLIRPKIHDDTTKHRKQKKGNITYRSYSIFFPSKICMAYASISTALTL